jgi:hypothetical protein
MLFAQRFLSDAEPGSPSPGSYDDLLDLRVDAHGQAIVSLTAAALAGAGTKGDLDPAGALGPTETRADLDPDRVTDRHWLAGPVKTSADLDRARPTLS